MAADDQQQPVLSYAQPGTSAQRWQASQGWIAATIVSALIQFFAPQFIIAAEQASDFARPIFAAGWLLVLRLAFGALLRQRSVWWAVYLALHIALTVVALKGWRWL